MVPANTWSPTCTALGSVSPVIRLVSLGDAGQNASVDADPLAHARQHHHAWSDPRRRKRALPAVGVDHHHGAGVQGQQPLGGRAGPAARPAVEITADQQEEQQHHGRIEVGVLAAAHGLEQAHGGRQHDPYRDRHVHVGAAAAQRSPGRGEEWAPRIGDRRQRDQRREPVQQRPRRLAHALRVPSPHRDREQHDVAGGKARHRHGAQELPLLAGIAGCERRRVVGHRPEAQLLEDADELGAEGRRAMPGEREPARREVDPRLVHRRLRAQRALDAAHAAAAVHALDHKVEAVLIALRAHVGADAGATRHLGRRSAEGLSFESSARAHGRR
jgi:hypothetical protein